MAERRSIPAELARIVLPVAILALGVGGFLVLKGQEKPPEKEVEEEKPPLVKTKPVTAHEGGLEIAVDGVVVPFREIALSAEVDGTIRYKADVCRAGNYVQKETVLLKIDPRDYALEICRLWAGDDSMDRVCEELEPGQPHPESLIPLAQAELKLQTEELERLKGLGDAKRPFGGSVVSEAEIDQGELTEIRAKNTVATLRNQLEKAILSLKRTKIASPIDGVVVSDSVEQGDFVRRGTPLVTIEDTSKVEVRCSLRMDELYWLWSQSASGSQDSDEKRPRAAYQIPNAPVTVVYHLAGRDYEWAGRLWRYEGIGLDETTRTVPCRVVVDAPRTWRVRASGPAAPANPLAGPPALVRGMYVTVRIHADPNAALLEIPEDAVRPGKRAWLVRDGKLAVVEVDVVRVADEVAIIRVDGIAVGDKVVVTALAGAEDGMTIREQSGP